MIKINNMSEISEVGKIVNYNQITELISSIKSLNKTIVFTNGCFDLIHLGHLCMLNRAKLFGDILIVGINSDSSIKRIKGDRRPVFNQQYRALQIACLHVVDYVIVFEQDNSVKLIEQIQPDILVKGSDWKYMNIPEEKIMIKNNKNIIYIDNIEGISSTKIISEIVKSQMEDKGVYK